MSAESDYQEGDFPVPIGTVVRYFGSHAHGLYEIIEHGKPNPEALDPEVNYPDGVGYGIWPVGVERRFGNRHLGVYAVRRTSFTIEPQ